MSGTLGDYVYWECGVNRVLFTTLGVSDEEFLAVVRRAAEADVRARLDFVREVDESPEAPSAFNDQQMLDRETAAQIDIAVVAWVRDVLHTPRETLDAMNTAFERMEPETPEQHARFDAELRATGRARGDISTYADLLDLQEARLT